MCEAVLSASPQSGTVEFYAPHREWVDRFLAEQRRLATMTGTEEQKAKAATTVWLRLKERFPVEWDWLLQDGRAGQPSELNFQFSNFNLQELAAYAAKCEVRREERLQTVRVKAPRLVFTQHRTLRPSFFAYTEGQSDAQNERHFLPGAELCLLELDGRSVKLRTLIADPQGAIRDPAASLDGTKVVFAWKKSLDEDDYHLYELDLVSGKTRQLTSGLGFADYEPAFLPSGDLIFASTRCVQTVDCWWTEVSNLYTCDAGGRLLRRVSFDQVHAIFPQVLDDGRVIYTRWDYNDRGQIFPQALFQMRWDGTGQSEFYGNNSWFPTTMAHARGIPGTQKVMTILCGHHTSQAGKLAVIDPEKGRQENAGVQLVAPIRETPADRIDSYGQDGALWQYPFPLNDRECVVAFAPLGWDQPQDRRGDADFGIYWMDVDGARELLAWDKDLPCTQPVALTPRSPAFSGATQVDYAADFGTFYLRDVYAGDGLKGVARGTIKKLRVVALEFRAAGIGNNGSAGPGGAALVSTPVSIGNGSWDVKKVLGEATVYDDGSALFTVPARTPVYFQALDERGFAVQSMRSWSTLQPGEAFSCAGCHDAKNRSPSVEHYRVDLATRAGPEALATRAAVGFSFPKQVQPILDRHCIQCHRDRMPLEALARGSEPVLTKTVPRAPGRPPGNGAPKVAFSLLGHENLDPLAKRKWSDSYLALTASQLDRADESKGSFIGDYEGRLITWISSQSVPEPLPPWSAGAGKSGLLKMLVEKHQGVELSSQELRTLACWIDLLVPYCGDYLEANAWSSDELAKYEHYSAKRSRMRALESASIRELSARKSSGQ